MKTTKWAFISVAAIFLMPWAHWLVYKNLLLAWPDMQHDAAHCIGAISAIFVPFFIRMMLEFS